MPPHNVPPAPAVPLAAGATPSDPWIEATRRYPSLYAFVERDTADAIAADNAEAVGWSMLFAAGLAGFLLGLLAVGVPAILLAWWIS
jgi:hypothetical protein